MVAITILHIESHRGGGCWCSVSYLLQHQIHEISESFFITAVTDIPSKASTRGNEIVSTKQFQMGNRLQSSIRRIFYWPTAGKFVYFLSILWPIHSNVGLSIKSSGCVASRAETFSNVKQTKRLDSFISRALFDQAGVSHKSQMGHTPL